MSPHTGQALPVQHHLYVLRVLVVAAAAAYAADFVSDGCSYLGVSTDGLHACAGPFYGCARVLLCLRGVLVAAAAAVLVPQTLSVVVAAIWACVLEPTTGVPGWCLSQAPL